MKTFINEDFLLTNDYARELYHESAEKMLIMDYHCSLVPKMIADNHQFKDLTAVWPEVSAISGSIRALLAVYIF